MATIVKLCRYYALCDRPADGYVANPIVGLVPTCQRCADRHDITLEPLVSLWGTDRAAIGQGFCRDCERDEGHHYRICPRATHLCAFWHCGMPIHFEQAPGEAIGVGYWRHDDRAYEYNPGTGYGHHARP